MSIPQKSVGQITILELTPKVMAEVAHDLFVLVIQTLLAEGRSLVIVDISQLRWINSQGLGLLVGAYRIVNEHGGRIVIAGPQRRVQDLMRIVGMLSVWDVYETVDEAVASFEEVGEAEA